MRLQTTQLFLAGFLSILFVSCSSKSNIPVPEDASFVMHINGASLSAKLPGEEFQQSELFKLAMEESKDSLAMKILKDPEESGLNLHTDAYLFTRNQGKRGYIAFVCELKDAAKFESFIKQMDAERKIETKDGLSMITNDENVVTWNKERLVLLAGTPGNLMAGKEYSDDVYSTDSLVHYAKEIYGLKKSKSIGNNSKFASLLKEEGDMHMWINAGTMYGNALPSILAISKAGLLFKDNISTATINFEEGKITFKGKNYVNKELEALYKKYDPKAFDESALQKIPAGKVDALFAFQYPPEGLKDFLSLLGVDGLLNAVIAKADISIDDFVKANKGEILFSVSDFKIENKEMKMPYGNGENYTYNTTAPSAKLLFATSINEQPAFDKLISVLTETLSKEGAEATEMLNKIPYVVKDKWFVAGNDSTAVHAFGTTSTTHDFINKIKGHPMGGYVNIQSFIAGTKNSIAKDSVAGMIADKSMQTWNDIVIYGGEFKNNGVESYAEINMVDTRTNSLKQLNAYFGFIARIMKDQQQARKSAFENVEEPSVITED